MERRVSQVELIGDVPLDPFGRGGGVTVHANVGEGRLEDFELTVLRTEVVAPGADAVGFVDGEKRHIRFTQRINESSDQTLGRQIEKLQLLRAHLFEDVLPFGGREHAVEAGGGDAAGGEGIDLVLH